MFSLITNMCPCGQYVGKKGLEVQGPWVQLCQLSSIKQAPSLFCSGLSFPIYKREVLALKTSTVKSFCPEHRECLPLN